MARKTIAGKTVDEKPKKFFIVVTPEILAVMHRLKRGRFYDKSFADVLRYMLTIAISHVKFDDEKAREQSA